MTFLNAVFDSDVLFAVTISFMALIYLAQRRDFSRLGAVLFGLSLIGAAAWFTFHMQVEWFPIAEGMTIGKQPRLTSDQLKQFEAHVNFFQWLFPFVSASLGTNILSDALSTNFTYRDDWFVTRIVSDILSGDGDWMPKKYGKVSLETRRGISSDARRDLQRLLAGLPQFAAVGQTRAVLNMTDGSVVDQYAPRDDNDFFDCKLTIIWQQGRAPVDVDARQYLEVQLQAASTLGCNTAKIRRKADRLFRLIMDW
jgi:hypothetical protein